MSLFGLDEICRECSKAIIHECCGRFCRCKDGHEDDTSSTRGTCPYKVERPSPEVKSEDS